MMLDTLCAVLDKTAKISVVDSLILAAIGILLVFAVLIILQLIISLMGLIVDNSAKLQKAHPEWSEKIANTKNKMMFWKKAKKEEPAKDVKEETKEVQLASGSCGDLKLIQTDERDAAMIMAIVADNLNTPLNELHFKSIKKIQDGEEK